MKTNFYLTVVLIGSVYAMGNLGRFTAETIPAPPSTDQVTATTATHH